MPLSPETIAALEAAKVAVEEWQAQKEKVLTEQADFLASVDVPTLAVADPAISGAVEEAESLIDSILSS